MSEKSAPRRISDQAAVVGLAAVVCLLFVNGYFLDGAAQAPGVVLAVLAITAACAVLGANARRRKGGEA
ncbi:hypothetical protein [Streptomonospora alba]|uniref:hypothetical protein n=1 Tax=Streptomonospora alba TaxID=183763 RepID=UPI0012EDCDE6|nr:hypothetical protein [Streptomonospora alba]